MAARGSVLKQEIAQKILATFPGSFLYNDGKEIRINGTEDGQSIQIKVTLTAAKTAVEGGNNVAPSGETATNIQPIPISREMIPQEPTAAEKERLATLLNKMGL